MCECVCGLKERAGVNFDGLDGQMGVLKKEHSAFYTISEGQHGQLTKKENTT